MDFLLVLVVLLGYIFLISAVLSSVYQRFWGNYANFSGRSSRSDYWWSYLISRSVGLIFSLLVFVNEWVGLTFFSIWYLAIFIPSLAITIRRLRDGGHSWPWVFINFVPVIGEVWFLVLLCMPTKRSNSNNAR